MFLWFAILAPVAVAQVFKSPMVDYRLVAVGALLPLVELTFGGPRVLHTLVVSVAAMGLVMASTSRRRLLRRRLLGIPIGLMVHLVLDGSWANQNLFWWPAFGADFPNDGLPAWSRSLLFGLLLEIAAVTVAVWAYRQYELDKVINRELLMNEGQLARSVLQ
jgi:hypothetical protein